MTCGDCRFCQIAHEDEGKKNARGQCCVTPPVFDPTFGRSRRPTVFADDPACKDAELKYGE